MKREIKFRGWHKELKVMLNVYVISQQTFVDGYVKGCHGYYGENNQVIFSFDQVEWLEFTGLKDKNKNDIYEGDIVIGNNGKPFPVTFESGSFKWDDEPLGWDLNENPPAEVDTQHWAEVIGNIFVNPELIKL